jgi:hypothetical protein
LEETEEDVTALKEAVEAVERGEVKKVHLSQHELSNRKKFVQETFQFLKKVKDDLNSQHTLGKIERDKREKLALNQRRADKISKFEEAVEKDNQAFIDNQMQVQQTIIKNQDKTLDEISEATGKLKEVGHTIDQAITRQAGMIDDIGHKIDTADSRLKQSARKVQELLESTKDSTQWCIIIFLFLVLIGLLVAVFYV